MPIFLRFLERVLVFILRDVARYRINVIRKNLSSSFAYASERELWTDIEGNYRFLAMILRQVISKPSKSLLSTKMSIELFPSINNWLREGKSVIVTMGHIGNWEWAGLYLGMQYPGHVCALYKEIKSKSINQFMLRRRSTTVDHLVEVSKMSELIRLIKRKPVLILMIADQNPGNDQGIIWTTFLKKNTAFVSGPETLALKFQMPVVYLNSISTPNGHYQLKFDLITDGNYALPPGEITRLYANALEQNIMLQRTEWLWTHKRWKRNESY